MATNKRANFENDMNNLYERADRLGWDNTKRANAYNLLVTKHKSYLNSMDNRSNEPIKNPLKIGVTKKFRR